jgi:hypothetical protein
MELEELEELEEDAATIFCRFRGGDEALPAASLSLFLFLDDMVWKSGFGMRQTGPCGI